MRDYEDLVKSLRYCAEYDCTTVCPRAGTGNGCITRLKKEAADAIEDLIFLLTASNEVVANRRPKWISVEERLPEKGVVVLAFGTRSATTGQFQGVGTAPWFWWWKGHTIKRVTHWMPLPPPPEEVSPHDL